MSTSRKTGAAAAHTMTLTNQKVAEFYKTHELNFEQMNVLFVNMLETMMATMDNSMTASVATRLVSGMDGIASRLALMDARQQESAAVLEARFGDCTREYMADLRGVLTNNTVEHVLPLIRESNENLVSKTLGVLNDVLPQTRAMMSENIDAAMARIAATLQAETSRLMATSLDRDAVSEFKTAVTQTMSQTHAELSAGMLEMQRRMEVHSERGDRCMGDIHTMVTEQHAGVTDVLKRFDRGTSSGSKGAVSENIAYNVILGMYPCAQVEHVGSDKETGDIILMRTGRPKILFENKDHDSKNVPKHEVDKFIRDCEIQKCCGVMMSQNRGITNKENFELQIHGGNVLLYLHEVHFDADKIKVAVDIVENIKMTLDGMSVAEATCVIEADVLETIRQEFSGYMTQRGAMMKLVRDFSEKMTLSLNELKLPSMETILAGRFATADAQTSGTCKYCEKFILRSMSQHYRHCTAKRAGVVAGAAPTAGVAAVTADEA